jgi:Rieske Fe-S protein
MKIDDSYIRRRRFLRGMLGGGTAALGLSVVVPVVPYVGNLREEPPPLFLELDKSQYDLPPGTSKIVPYGRIPAILIRTPEPASELRIFVANCTHLDCTVGYEAETNRIVCECHMGYFDIDGNVLDGPPPRPLKPFVWEFRDAPEGGDPVLVIALEKENLEEALHAP